MLRIENLKKRYKTGDVAFRELARNAEDTSTTGRLALTGALQAGHANAKHAWPPT